MGLFRNWMQTEQAEVNYQDVVDYLREMTQPDFNKILKVVGIYREADRGVKKVLGIKGEPVNVTFDATESFLDDDDLSLGGFLDDDQPKAKANKKVKSKK